LGVGKRASGLRGKGLGERAGVQRFGNLLDEDLTEGDIWSGLKHVSLRRREGRRRFIK